MDIHKYLSDIEERIDPETEDRLLADWQDFIHGRTTTELFKPVRRKPSPARFEWPAIRVNDFIDDYDLMLVNQLHSCSILLESRPGVLMARANYGTSILPSLFGVDLFMMPPEMNTLPTSVPLHDKERIREIVKRGLPDIRGGLGRKVFDFAGHFMKATAQYPKIRHYVPLYHPDLQGTMDVCEVVWGSSVFIDLVDEPDLVKAFLDLVSDAYLAFMREWDRLVPSPRGYAYHWSILTKGHIMLRTDSAMNLSPAMFDEFIRPYEQKLLDGLGGGAIHFCGRGDHYIESMSAMPGLTGIAMSQPHLNDMEVIYRNTVDKGIPLLSFNAKAAAEALAAGRPLRGRVHTN
jgi:hypothetical protein